MFSVDMNSTLVIITIIPEGFQIRKHFLLLSISNNTKLVPYMSFYEAIKQLASLSSAEVMCILTVCPFQSLCVCTWPWNTNRVKSHSTIDFSN